MRRDDEGSCVFDDFKLTCADPVPIPRPDLRKVEALVCIERARHACPTTGALIDGLPDVFVILFVSDHPSSVADREVAG
jgi:hypothetical protein